MKGSSVFTMTSLCSLGSGIQRVRKSIAITYQPMILLIFTCSQVIKKSFF